MLSDAIIKRFAAAGIAQCCGTATTIILTHILSTNHVSYWYLYIDMIASVYEYILFAVEQ